MKIKTSATNIEKYPVADPINQITKNPKVTTEE